MTTASDDRPWLKFYDGAPADIEVPDTTMYEALAAQAARTPAATAFIFMGRRFTYAQALAEVDACAAAFRALGVGPRDAVVLSLPNVPTVVFCFYALNRIGAIAVMTHPLSSPGELRHYISITGARTVVTLDMFYPVFHELATDAGLERLVIGSVADYLPPVTKVGFALTRARKLPKVPADDPLVTRWTAFRAAGATIPDGRQLTPDDTCAILFSGGTTDLPKGIELSSAAFNALANSMVAASGIAPGDSVLAILPAFHGFGLGLCIHTALTMGAHFVLVAEFSPKIYIANLTKHHPSYIAGVPTLFEALLRDPAFAEVRFDSLKGAYSGGDMLSPDLKHRFDAALFAQGSPVELMEGYGLTECVTGCVLSPPRHYRENSMGIPTPGMLMKVIEPGTTRELPPDTEGEFAMTGPTLMKGYLGDPAATAETLRVHEDGRTWLHTGDLGTMDADGYLYFRGRSKRLIKVSGVAVYPVQVEQVLEAHPLVARACVIGLPDDYQMSSVKAFVVLADGSLGSDDVKAQLIAHCREQLNRWSVPRHLEFRTALPMTKVGKVAYTELEREEAAKAGKADTPGRAEA